MRPQIQCPFQKQLLGTQTEIPVWDMMVLGAEYQSSHQFFGYPCGSHRVFPSTHSIATSDSMFFSFSTCLFLSQPLPDTALDPWAAKVHLASICAQEVPVSHPRHHLHCIGCRSTQGWPACGLQDSSDFLLANAIPLSSLADESWPGEAGRWGLHAMLRHFQYCYV